MYDNLYEVYNNIKSESVDKLQKIKYSTKRIKSKNTKKIQSEEARTLSDDDEEEEEARTLSDDE